MFYPPTYEKHEKCGRGQTNAGLKFENVTL